MSRWTASQVADLAPDQSSLAAARRLARPGPWSDTGSTDTLVWGKCQGSGRIPYQVSVDLTEPGFRCSCPSRKLPCKHGLALLLLWVDGSQSVADAENVAAFAEQWAAERSARAAASAAGGAGRPARTVDPVAAARRLDERRQLMTNGMEDFARWLTDLARSGTAAARQQPYRWWDGTAARLVDAQLPGLADDVRSVGGEVSGRADWAEHLLLALGRWWTATRAWARRESLDADELGDLRAYLGWAVSTESVRQGAVAADRWLVLGAHRSDDGRLQQQRTWLQGARSGLTVQVLDFAAGGQVLPVARVVGSRLDASLALYPGRGVRRALFVDEPVVVTEREPFPVGSTLGDATAAHARLLAANPWARRAPVLLADVGVGLTTDGGGAARAVVAGGDGTGFPVTADVAPWSLLALTGGRPVRLFAELEGASLRPLTVVLDDEAVGL